MTELSENKSGAKFSNDRKYRYMLWRVWDESLPKIMFVGLNPSQADEVKDDPTIRRVIGFAKKWGYGGVYMLNCFPLISTDPKALEYSKLDDWFYSRMNVNSVYMFYAAKKCKEVVFAWGNSQIVSLHKRDLWLKELFPNAKCLIKNKNGTPRHPLCVPLISQLINFSNQKPGTGVLNNNYMVEAIFQCNANTPIAGGSENDTSGSVNLHAIYGNGNESWSKYTPSGQIQMQITNPSALEYFKQGKRYKVTFEEVPEGE